MVSVAWEINVGLLISPLPSPVREGYNKGWESRKQSFKNVFL